MNLSLSQLRDAALSAFLVTGVAYNVLVAINSDQGARMKASLDQEIEAQKVVLAELQGDHDYLADRVFRLRSETIDRDLLDERVRSVLGLVDRGEYLVRMSDLQTLAAASVETLPESRDSAIGEIKLAALASER